MRKLTLDEFIEKARLLHGNKYDYSKVEYDGNRKKVCIICPEHGEFWQTPNAHLQGQGCPLCSRVNRDPRRLFNDENKRSSRRKVLLEKFIAVHGDKYDYNIIGNEKCIDYIDITCKKHNYTWRQRIANHLRGSGCPLCNGGTNRPYTTEEFIIRANEVHDGFYTYEKTKYINKDTPVIITCPVHGDFEQKPHYHINGNGCPHCKAWKTQRKVFLLLQTNFPDENWKWEYKADWLGNQRIDIYNERVKLAIEYNGEQHYMPIEIFGGTAEYEKRLILDERKKNILQQHGDHLYIIKYDEFNTEKIIDDIKNLLYNENS